MRKVCIKFHCNKFAVNDSRYCSVHSSKKVDRVFDRRYGSSRWKRLRIEKLKDNPVCEECGAVACLVHHIDEVRDGGEFWDMDNLQSLCRCCHEIKHGNRFTGKKVDLVKWKEFLNED